VEEALSGKNHFGPVGVCPDINSLVNNLSRTGAPIALVDIDSQPAQLLDSLGPIVNRFVHVRFVVISSECGSDLVFKAMQVGVRHIQMKNTIQSELCAVLERLVETAPSHESEHGIAISILSASGGCGCTTLAVNLANELRLKNSERVLLVDLDHTYGSVGTYLDMHGQFGVGDVLTHKAGIDTQLLRTTATRFSENLDVLLSPAGANSPSIDVAGPEKLMALIAACKKSYAITIFDAPRISIGAASALAGESERIFIVLQLLVPHIRFTKTLLSDLVRNGISESRITALINRYRKRGNMVDLKDAAKALEGISLAQLNNDYTSVIRALNYGTPLADAAPKSVIRRDINQLTSTFFDSKVASNGKLHVQAGASHEPV